MDYTQITLTVLPEKLEYLVNELYAMDIFELAIEDPSDVDLLMNKKEAYEWDYIDAKLLQKSEYAKVHVYVSKDEAGLLTLSKIESILNESTFEDVKMSSKQVNEADWKDVWKEFFKPARITDKITIKPSWEEYKKVDENEMVINIDPGMAFGTGTHETTTLCIKLLEKYAHSKSVLDVGTGSGILSIAAKKLGIESVLAVDIDDVCVEIAKENLKLNGICDVSVIQGDLTKGLDVKVDFVVANLMADLVMFLAKSVKEHLNTDGVFISSGILIEKEEQVIDELQKNGFEIIEILEQGEWCAIAARSKVE